MTVKCLDNLSKEKVVKSYLCGVKQKELAEIWNVSARTIHRVLVEQGIMPPEGARVLATPDEQQMLEIIRRLNLDSVELLERLSAPTITPANLLKSLGQMPDKAYMSLIETVSGVRAAQEIVNPATLN